MKDIYQISLMERVKIMISSIVFFIISIVIIIFIELISYKARLGKYF